MSSSLTPITSVRSANLASSLSDSSSPTDFASTRSRSSFLLSRPSTMSEQTCPPSSSSRPFTTTPYFSSTFPISSRKQLLLATDTLHRSHRLVCRVSCTRIFSTSPGSPSWRRGTARLMKALRMASSLQPLRNLTSSIVCRAAMQLVVVDSAGMILPAFSFTPIHSISSSLQLRARRFAIEQITSMCPFWSSSFSNSSALASTTSPPSFSSATACLNRSKSSTSPSWASSFGLSSCCCLPQLLTSSAISLAALSEGTNASTLKPRAISAISLRLRGSLKSLGWGTACTLLSRTAQEAMKVACRGSSGLISWMGVGGRLGSLQKGLPSLVLASRGQVQSSCRMSFLKIWQKTLAAVPAASSKFAGRSESIFRQSLSIWVSEGEGAKVFSDYSSLASALGARVKSLPNRSRAHSTQCRVSSGNILSVQCGTSPLASLGSCLLPQVSVRQGRMTWTCPLELRVPLSSRATLFSTQRLSTQRRASTLSSALATMLSPSKNSLLKMSLVASQTLSRRALMCPFRRGFICAAAAAAVALFGLRRCFSRKRNWRLRFEVSMWSGSVTTTLPCSPAPASSIARFFSSSHPIAPDPTTKIFAPSSLLSSSSPITLRIPSLRSLVGCLPAMNFAQSSSSSGGASTTSEKSARKYWWMGVYLPVMALKTSCETMPPQKAQIGPKLPEQVQLKSRTYFSSSPLSSAFSAFTSSSSCPASSLLQAAGSLPCLLLKPPSAMNASCSTLRLPPFVKSQYCRLGSMLCAAAASASDLKASFLGVLMLRTVPSPSQGEKSSVLPMQKLDWSITCTVCTVPLMPLLSSSLCRMPFTPAITTVSPSSQGCRSPFATRTTPLSAIEMSSRITSTVSSPFLSRIQNSSPKSLKTCPQGPQQSAERKWILLLLQNQLILSCSWWGRPVATTTWNLLREARSEGVQSYLLTFTQWLSSCSLQMVPSRRGLPTSPSPRKNCPLRSAHSVACPSHTASSLQPLSTTFFAISTPSAPRPSSRMLALLCLDTASTPIAPMQRLHRSLTRSSLMSISTFSRGPPQLTSISSSAGSVLPGATLCWARLGLAGEESLRRSSWVGGGRRLSSISSSLTAFSSMLRYSPLLFLKVLHQLQLWSLTSPLQEASRFSASLSQRWHSSRISSRLRQKWRRMTVSKPLGGLRMLSIMANLTLPQRTMFAQASFFFSPSSVPCSCSKPGSLKQMSSLMMIDWMLTSTCSSVDTFGSQFSIADPRHVPSRLRHTFPQEQRLGLKRICALPVVVRFTFGGPLGQLSSKWMSKRQAPWPQGVPFDPMISACMKSTRSRSQRTKMALVWSMGSACETSASSCARRMVFSTGDLCPDWQELAQWCLVILPEESFMSVQSKRRSFSSTGYFLLSGSSSTLRSSSSSLCAVSYSATALSTTSNVAVIFFAISSETFSEAEPVRQERKIFEVLASVLRRECSASGCLGSQTLGMAMRVGISFFDRARTWMKLSSPWISSAYFEISSSDPPRREFSMMGRRALSQVWSTISSGSSNSRLSRNFSRMVSRPRICSDCSFLASSWPVTSHFWLVGLSVPQPTPLRLVSLFLKSSSVSLRSSEGASSCCCCCCCYCCWTRSRRGSLVMRWRRLSMVAQKPLWRAQVRTSCACAPSTANTSLMMPQSSRTDSFSRWLHLRASCLSGSPKSRSKSSATLACRVMQSELKTGKQEQLSSSFRYCSQILLCSALVQFFTHPVSTPISFSSPLFSSKALKIVSCGTNAPAAVTSSTSVSIVLLLNSSPASTSSRKNGTDCDSTTCRRVRSCAISELVRKFVTLMAGRSAACTRKPEMLICLRSSARVISRGRKQQRSVVDSRRGRTPRYFSSRIQGLLRLIRVELVSSCCSHSLSSYTVYFSFGSTSSLSAFTSIVILPSPQLKATALLACRSKARPSLNLNRMCPFSLSATTSSPLGEASLMVSSGAQSLSWQEMTAAVLRMGARLRTSVGCQRRCWPFFQRKKSGTPLKALMRGKKKFWMKNWWCEASKLFSEVIRLIRISLNSSWHSLPMQLAWNSEISCFIVSGAYFSSRLFSLLTSSTIRMGALAARRRESEGGLPARVFSSTTWLWGFLTTAYSLRFSSSTRSSSSRTAAVCPFFAKASISCGQQGRTAARRGQRSVLRGLPHTSCTSLPTSQWQKWGTVRRATRTWKQSWLRSPSARPYCSTSLAMLAKSSAAFAGVLSGAAQLARRTLMVTMSTYSLRMLSSVQASSLAMFSRVSLPSRRRLTRRGLAPFERSTCSRMFSPSRFSASSTPSITSFGNRSFSTWMISSSFWSNSSEATSRRRSGRYFRCPRNPSSVTQSCEQSGCSAGRPSQPETVTKDRLQVAPFLLRCAFSRTSLAELREGSESRTSRARTAAGPSTGAVLKLMPKTLTPKDRQYWSSMARSSPILKRAAPLPAQSSAFTGRMAFLQSAWSLRAKPMRNLLGHCASELSRRSTLWEMGILAMVDFVPALPACRSLASGLLSSNFSVISISLAAHLPRRLSRSTLALSSLRRAGSAGAGPTRTSASAPGARE